MSAIRTPRVQLGISPTSNNNFTIYTDSGTNQLFLTRGNYNSTLTNVAALETNGFLTFLGNSSNCNNSEYKILKDYPPFL